MDYSDRRRVLLSVDDIVFSRSAGILDPRPQCEPLNGTQNLGINLPRIRIMQEILDCAQSADISTRRQYDWVLEVHDDMLFPSSWFAALWAAEDPTVGILQPFLFRDLDFAAGSQPPPTDAIEKQLASLYTNVTLGSFTRAVHPWLLRVNMVREIGYYDPLL
jgi:hypothetical protein